MTKKEPTSTGELWCCVVRFQRAQFSLQEFGVAVGKYVGMSDIDHIIDSDGKRLDQVWSYTLMPALGCFAVLSPRSAPRVIHGK